MVISGKAARASDTWSAQIGHSSDRPSGVDRFCSTSWRMRAKAAGKGGSVSKASVTVFLTQNAFINWMMRASKPCPRQTPSPAAMYHNNMRAVISRFIRHRGDVPGTAPLEAAEARV